MIELDIYEARIYFSGKEPELKRMFECLRVKDPNSYFKTRALIKKVTGFWSSDRIDALRADEGWLKFYNRRNDTFQTGLLPLVKKYLTEQKIPFKINDYRKKKPRFDLEKSRPRFRRFSKDFEYREEQEVAFCAALKRSSGILHLSTNAGKTFVAATIVAEYGRQIQKNPCVLYLVHRISLADQTATVFRNLLNIPVKIIGGGQKKIPEKGVLVASVQTASRLLKTSDFKRFLSRCDILFIDEMHVNKAKQLQKIANLCRARMRFGLSGTIDKDNKIKMMHFIGLVGPVIAEVRNKELVDLGRSARPFIRLIEPAAEHVSEDLSFGEAYRAAIVYSKGRNKAVVREALRYVDKGKRTLITVGRIAHGLILKRLLEKRMDVKVPFISGSTPLHVRKSVKKGFIQRRSPILIASPIFDVGEDLPAIDAWCNASGGKGWELVLQRLGRTLRRKEGRNVVYITDFLDMHSHYLAKHSLARFQYYLDEKIAKIKVIRRKDA